MKVKELISLLSEFEGDIEIVLSRDAEGNGYSPLESAWLGSYDADAREVGLIELTPELAGLGYDEDDVMEGGEIAVILTPLH